MKSPNLLRMLLAAIVAVALAGVLAACGSDDDGGNESAAGNGTDLAFAEEMVAHHQSAIDMAEIAQEQGDSEFVTQLADEIISAQQAEITVMNAAMRNLENSVTAEDLGMSEDMMGMDMDASMLESADPFDREFVDMMIPHHQGAIRMARVELEQGNSPALKELAEDVVAAQTREIEEMNAFRQAEFGAESPAGGAPPENESGEPMDHSGH